MKNDLRILLFSTVLGMAAAGPAQEPSGPGQAPKAATEPQQPATAEQYIEQLGSDSYRERLTAERRLREMGKAALPALERAAESSDDGEVQWRARRLVRQIRQAAGPDQGPGGLVERRREGDQEPEAVDPGIGPRRSAGDPLRGRDFESMREQFDRLFRDFERDFGMDIPRHRFFDDSFYRDLEAQFERARDSVNQSQGISVQIGPDGVHVEVTEVGKEGKTEKKVYDAPDMETFHKQYPDVLRQNGLGMGLSPLGGGMQDPGRGFVSPLQRGFDWPVRPRVVPFGPGAIDVPQAEALPPTGRRLGVSIRELPETLRDYLELDADTGLMVEAVQPDSLAQALGLMKDDIVTQINEQKIGSPADVQRALGAIDKGQTVTVEFVRKGRRQTAETQKTESATQRAPLEKSDSNQPGAIR